MRIANYLLIFFSVFLIACSSSEETLTKDQKKEPDIYLFTDLNNGDTTAVKMSERDNVVTDTQKVINSPETIKSESPIKLSKKYFIQVAAFSTMERAQSFVKENQSKIPYLLNISLRQSDNYYIVRLHPFDKREDAESIKDKIRQIASFKDAFIVNPE